MKDLASVHIEVPINIVNEWENYFWYATGPSPSALPVFKVVIGESGFITNGQWVEKGQPLKAIKSYDINVRSPISGLIKDTYRNGIIIQPKKDFIFPENAGELMFREVVNFGHRIENELAQYKAMSSLNRLIFDLRNGGSPWSYVESRRASPKDLLKSLDELLNAKCKLLTNIF